MTKGLAYTTYQKTLMEADFQKSGEDQEGIKLGLRFLFYYPNGS